MEATQILMSEHRVIEHALHALDAAARCLEQGREIRPGLFLDAGDFITGFADGWHHVKEEGALFKALAEHGVPVEGGPIGVMLHDHEQGRAFARALREAALRLEADPAALELVISNARSYAALMGLHILKEDQVLFPMADRLIEPESQWRVMESFKHIEGSQAAKRTPEGYAALAIDLDMEAAKLLMEA